MEFTQAQINYLIKEVLGYQNTWSDIPEEWKDFVENYFHRSGIINNISYTAEQNKVLSVTAMLQTIGEIKSKLILLDCNAT